MSYAGEIRLFAAKFAPQGFVACNGQLLQVASYPDLSRALGTTYGGDGASTFAVPNLGATLPVGAGNGLALGSSGHAPLASRRASDPMTWIMWSLNQGFDQTLIGEIRTFAFGYPIDGGGWLPCEGQLLPIAQYVNLFQLIQTTYGGDGQIMFGLPDLRGSAPHGNAASPSIGFQVLSLCISTNGIYPFHS